MAHGQPGGGRACTQCLCVRGRRAMRKGLRRSAFAAPLRAPGRAESGCDCEELAILPRHGFYCGGGAPEAAPRPAARRAGCSQAADGWRGSLLWLGGCCRASSGRPGSQQLSRAAPSAPFLGVPTFPCTTQPSFPRAQTCLNPTIRFVFCHANTQPMPATTLPAIHDTAHESVTPSSLLAGPCLAAFCFSCGIHTGGPAARCNSLGPPSPFVCKAHASMHQQTVVKPPVLPPAQDAAATRRGAAALLPRKSTGRGHSQQGHHRRQELFESLALLLPLPPLLLMLLLRAAAAAARCSCCARCCACCCACCWAAARHCSLCLSAAHAIYKVRKDSQHCAALHDRRGSMCHDPSQRQARRTNCVAAACWLGTARCGTLHGRAGARQHRPRTCSALMGPCFHPSARPVAHPEAAPFQAAATAMGVQEGRSVQHAMPPTCSCKKSGAMPCSGMPWHGQPSAMAGHGAHAWHGLLRASMPSRTAHPRSTMPRQADCPAQPSPAQPCLAPTHRRSFAAGAA